VREYYDRGKYVPDDLTIELIMGRLAAPDAAKGFILDGFPRTDAQARALDEHLAEKGEKVDVALHITAPNEVLVGRLAGRMVCPQCGSIYNAVTRPPKSDAICDLDGHLLERRSDEEADTVRTRLEVYANQTRPLIEYYRRSGSLIEIDGSRPIDEVEAEIDSDLGLRSSI
jgi:adenylate kinase